MEQMRLRGEAYSGAAVDISKFFDQVIRSLLYELARRAGMPERIIGAYEKFQEELLTMNTIMGGLGKPYRKPCGIPQGDPLSMMMVALLMRAWVVMMKEMKVMPSLLVDDILILSKGERAKEDFEKALTATHEYLIDMGATVAPGKSHVFASTKKLRKWLHEYTWPALGKTIKVVKQFRYLGGQIFSTEKMRTNVLKKRFARATAVASSFVCMGASSSRQGGESSAHDSSRMLSLAGGALIKSSRKQSMSSISEKLASESDIVRRRVL